MNVTIIAEGASRKLPSGASMSYPLGWNGDVPEADALRFIREGRAQASVDLTGDFSVQEKAVLKAAAQQAIAAAQAGAGETVDPETGEILGGDEASDAEVLASMTFAEVKALAKQKGVKYTARKRADIEADILAKLAAEDEADA